ncbi:hypothetical protein [Falsiroseomonas ponticola]|uniref:hypothetical protein n=1 Tax=Falsiroseomonas ponticola TaxID=2786951 RepID=UPI00193196C6|nr:hypothetical protein [Roseomonas ponticola]
MDASMLWPGLVALLVAAAVAGAARLGRRPALAALAAAAGLLAGWWWTMGLVTASPRQLPERLPLLAAALLLLAALGIAAARGGRFAGLATMGAGALATGWWMAGAPRTGADLAASLHVLAAVTALALLLLRRDAAWSAPAAALVLLAALVLARLPGPGVVLGVAAAGAALGGALAGALAGPAARRAPLLPAMPLAGGMAALAALPVLARGAAADWAAAAAPVLLLWAAPLLGRVLPVRIPAAALSALGGLAGLGGVWLLR